MLTDWRTAPVDERLRGAFAFLSAMTLRPDSLGAADVARLRATGVSDEAVGDLAYIGFVFNLLNRIADALGFQVPDEEGLNFTAKMLLRFGYG